MPHAVNGTYSQDEEDERLINQLLNAEPGQENLDFDPDRELETSALPDAEDFADIGDDDLPDEEPAVNGVDGLGEGRPNGVDPKTLYGEQSQIDDHEFDDLFGEEPAADDVGIVADRANGGDHSIDDSHPHGADGLSHSPNHERLSPDAESEPDLSVKPPQTLGTDEHAEVETAEEREQRLLFEKAREDWERREERIRTGVQDEDIPPPPETDAELLATIWPGYSQEENPRWYYLFKAKRVYYLHHTPLKPPKPIQPSKVNLDPEPDQERAFKLATGSTRSKRSREAFEEDDGIILIAQSRFPDDEFPADEDVSMGDFDDSEPIGGLTVGDLRILCESWDAKGEEDDFGQKAFSVLATPAVGDSDFKPPSAKRRKLDLPEFLQSDINYDDEILSFDDPMDLALRLSSHVPLDLKDPNLLLDFDPPPPTVKKPQRVGDARKKGGITKQLQARWNISQDKSYDLLKENHSHKIRATLTKLEVKHSSPALKLQYPFYKVKLTDREARCFHRPTIQLTSGKRILFDKQKKVKRSTVAHREPAEVFARAKDLSMGDNSDTLLLEYSEECPTMLSNFGMNSRFVNYYRRKDADDTARPKGEIGDTQVLLPHDNSPFSIFGNVEPGHTQPTIHNEMFRAPVFKHNPKQTDFLVIRSRTGVDGDQWHLRNLQNLYVVGQQFPYVEVPGVHARKVTDAAKMRLRMICYRIYSRGQRNNAKKPWLPFDEILEHMPGADQSALRPKIKEFMQYQRETTSWAPYPGDVVPDAQTVNSWVTPEHLCLLDSMQVGDRHLRDAGYNQDSTDIDLEEKAGESIEEQMAPWETTKNFLKACQGQAMLQLHGEGDPTARGEAFSFIKTSMKGGFKAIGESIEDRLDARKNEELGGHKYNVARQQQAYNEAIRRIWDAQTRSLSSTVEHSDTEMDVDDQPEHSARPGRTPRSLVGTPAATGRSRREDDSVSQFSRTSAADRTNRILRIRRRNSRSNEFSEELVRDPKIIREYLRRRRERDLENLRIDDIRRTGNAEYDNQQKNFLESELARLQRNKERRHVREKNKTYQGYASSVPQTPGSPSASGDTPFKAGASKWQAGATQRKCANCGQVGHIKTNKKLCPMYKDGPQLGFDNAAFGGGSQNNTDENQLQPQQSPATQTTFI